jgi:Ribosomal_S17 N-terminal
MYSFILFGLAHLCLPGGRKVATKDKRWYKDVGLGFKTPAEAINGHYIGTAVAMIHASPVTYGGDTFQTRSVLSLAMSLSVGVSSMARWCLRK